MVPDNLFPLLFAAGLVIAAVLYCLGLKRKGLKPYAAFTGFGAGLLLAFLLGKTLFILCSSYQFSDEGTAGFFRLDPSEFSFAGCCIGFVVGVMLSCLFHRIPVARGLDCFSLPGCLFFGFVQFGMIFAGQLGCTELSTFGLPELTGGVFPAFFPFAVEDSWGQWFLAVSTLEALVAFACAAYAALAARHGKASVPRAGLLFERNAFCLCACHFFLETTKIISLVFFYVHVDQVLCAVVMLILMIRACRRPAGKHGGFRWILLTLFILCIAVNGLSQFLLDKPWQFEFLLPEESFYWLNDHLPQVCYSLMLATALGMLGLYLPVSGKPAGKKAR